MLARVERLLARGCCFVFGAIAMVSAGVFSRTVVETVSLTWCLIDWLVLCFLRVR